MSSRRPTPVRNRLVGVLTVAVFVGLATFAYKYYKGDINPGVQVTLRSTNAGLLLDPQSKVSVKGVQVGTVRSVESVGGQATITMDINPDRARHIPSNVVADLRPTTLFGAKYVNLQLPVTAAPSHLENGDVIQERNGAQEADQVFQNVMSLLDEVQPQKINGALTALSGALDGRGEQLGQTITNFNTYLVGILPSMPQFNRDLVAANKVMPTYQQAAPDLVQALDNFRTTSNTLTSQSKQLSETLTGVAGVGGDTSALLLDSSAPLTGTVRDLQPTAATLQRYAPMMTCLLEGMTNLWKSKTYAPPDPYKGIWVTAALLPRARPYHYPEDLPVVKEDSGPRCFGLPNVQRNTPQPHYDFDTGRSPFVNGTKLSRIP